MRKWHRWLSVFFGVFLLWIAATGLASQVVPLLAGGEEHEEPGAAAAPATAAPAFVCPPDYNCRPKPKPGDVRGLVGTLHHLHSGETFGPVGVAISILSGIALLFFSFSGLWMYVQMWRNRKTRTLKPGWFWD